MRSPTNGKVRGSSPGPAQSFFLIVFMKNDFFATLDEPKELQLVFGSNESQFSYQNHMCVFLHTLDHF